MRLRDYQQLLERSIIVIKKISMTIIKNNSNYGRPNDVRVSGLVEFNDIISKFEKIELFGNLVTKIKKLEHYNRATDDIVVTEGDYNDLNNLRNKLLNQIENLKDAIDNILPIEDANTINFKLPSSISDISEVKDFINNFDLILHVYKEFSCDIKFQGVDSGSSWIVVAFAALPLAKKCIMFLFEMAEKSLELRNLKLEGDRKKLELEELKANITSKEYDNIVKARELKNEEDCAKLKETIAKKLLSNLELEEQYITNKNEVLEKIKMSLDKMGELLDLGMEIKPALNAPEEVKQISGQFNISLEEHKKILIGINPQKLIEQKDEQVVGENEENINEQE